MKFVHKNPWFNVIFRDGHYIIVEPFSGNSAAVLVQLRSGEFVFVKQKRPAVGKFTIEIPRGGAKNGESAIECAIREVLEETGIGVDPSELKFFGIIHPNSGILSSSVNLFYCCIDQTNVDMEVNDEIEEVLLLDFDKVQEYCFDGVICDSFSLSAMAKFLIYKNIPRELNSFS